MKSLSDVLKPVIKKFYPSYLSKADYEYKLLEAQNRLKQHRRTLEHYTLTGELELKEKKSYAHGAINPLDIPVLEKSFFRIFNPVYRTKKEYIKELQLTEELLVSAQRDFYFAQLDKENLIK